MASTPTNFPRVVAWNLFQNLKELPDQLCDVAIAVKEKEIAFHKIVLCLTSQKLRTRLLADLQNRTVTVENEDVSSESVEWLKEILYTGKDLTQDTAKDILKLAADFEIGWLVEHCGKFLLTNLQSNDCLDVWLIAHKYKLLDLEDKACKMTAQNIDKISTELPTLPKSMLMMLLSLQTKLNSDDVCRAVLGWMEHDPDVRANVVTQLLPFMQLECLSLACLTDLLAYHNHSSLTVMFDPILKVIRRFPFDNGRNMSLPVSIRATATERCHGISIEAWPDGQNPIVLASPPSYTNPIFSSCTWENDIYLSGCTSEKKKCFLVFKPADNKWEILKVWGGDGRKHHAMAAVNFSIFILGGLLQNRSKVKVPSPQVMKFSLESENWSLLLDCQLPIGVYGATAAVLGHRIYVFGGKDANGVNTDLVQCLDTRSESAYLAGRLPSASGLCALSNGGIIYVVLHTGKVLRMWERFELAEEREKNVTTHKDRNSIQQVKAEHAEKSPTIEFIELATISPRTHFGACIMAGKIKVYGGKDEKGDSLSDCTIIDILTGEVTRREINVNGAANFDLHVIKIPREHLQHPETASAVQVSLSRTSSTIPGSSNQPANDDERGGLPSLSDTEYPMDQDLSGAFHQTSPLSSPRRRPHKKARSK